MEEKGFLEVLDFGVERFGMGDVIVIVLLIIEGGGVGEGGIVRD